MARDCRGMGRGGEEVLYLGRSASVACLREPSPQGMSHASLRDDCAKRRRLVHLCRSFLAQTRIIAPSGIRGQAWPWGRSQHAFRKVVTGPA